MGVALNQNSLAEWPRPMVAGVRSGRRNQVDTSPRGLWASEMLWLPILAGQMQIRWPELPFDLCEQECKMNNEREEFLTAKDENVRLLHCLRGALQRYTMLLPI